MTTDKALETDLRNAVLTRLGFAKAPPADVAGLKTVYGAWCKHVPFDNLCKLIHVSQGNPEPLPGSGPADFFNSWLKHKAGGTCWAGNGALHSLLSSLGFNAKRGVATMLVSPELPPNHGTVVVTFDDCAYLVDASILHLVPLPLVSNCDRRQLPFQVGLDKREGYWYVRWTPFNHLNGLDCRIDYFPADFEDFYQRHETTRTWSPFNYSLTARTFDAGQMIGISNGLFFEMDQDGRVEQRQIAGDERIELLINRFGYAEEICRKLPPDRPTPPPPWSQTAKRNPADNESAAQSR